MKIKKYIGIYKITNMSDGKTYVGSSVDIYKRITNHKYALKANVHYNKYLQDSYNKYGKNIFLYEVVEECLIEKLIERENYYINFLESNNKNKGFNLALVNEFRRNTFNEEVKIKNSRINLKLYGNFTKFKAINIDTGGEIEFTTLVDAANFLKETGFLVGDNRWARMKISNHLRNVWGVKDGDRVRARPKKRRVSYKHHWEIIE